MWQRGGMHGEGGMCGKRGSMCAKGGMHNNGGHAVQREGHVWQGEFTRQGGTHGRGGGHVWQGGMHAGEMATEVCGTHPTGMHSFFLKV